MKKFWTQEECDKLEKFYKEGKSIAEISKALNRTAHAVQTKANNLGLGAKYIRPNNPNFKAPYQEYDWCYKRYVVKGMTYDEMAQEAGCKKRTIEKWCGDIHRLNMHTAREFLKLTDKQREIIISGTLGDGHICSDDKIPFYVESHAKDEKDYLYWKYGQLKNLCKSEPKYYPSITKLMNGKYYDCQANYRFNTRVINDLIPLRNMTITEKINELDDLGLALYFLDDGSRSKSNWQICIAEMTEEERAYFISVCADVFELDGHMQKDSRYIMFTSASSIDIDNMILQSLPNDLDIIQRKIMRWAA